jgi:hypothetical protein
VKMSKKPNPRKRPANMADVERATKKVRDEAIRYTSVIFLSVLCDKENADKEIIQRVWYEVNELSDSISKGYVSLSDLRNTLLNEYEINI